VSVQVPTDATEIMFGLVMDSDATDYYIDNVMAAATATAQTSLDWQPRNHVCLTGPMMDTGYSLTYTTPPDTSAHSTGDGTADTDYDINANRPAWATKVALYTQVYGTVINETFQVRPAGATNWLPAATLPVSGSFVGTFNPCNLGTNGQIEYSITNTSVDGYMTLNQWIGENL